MGFSLPFCNLQARSFITESQNTDFHHFWSLACGCLLYSSSKDIFFKCKYYACSWAKKSQQLLWFSCKRKKCYVHFPSPQLFKSFLNTYDLINQTYFLDPDQPMGFTKTQKHANIETMIKCTERYCQAMTVSYTCTACPKENKLQLILSDTG